jgi:CBS-domain-containing membrane protein
VQLVGVVHPPSGGTAVGAAVAVGREAAVGFGFVLIAAGGAIACVVVTVIVSNLFEGRSYPKHWI